MSILLLLRLHDWSVSLWLKRGRTVPSCPRARRSNRSQ